MTVAHATESLDPLQVTSYDRAGVLHGELAVLQACYPNQALRACHLHSAAGTTDIARRTMQI